MQNERKRGRREMEVRGKDGKKRAIVHLTRENYTHSAKIRSDRQ